MVELAVTTLQTFGVERGFCALPAPQPRAFRQRPRFRLRALVYCEEPIKFSIESWVLRNTDPLKVDAFAERLRTKLQAAVTEPFFGRPFREPGGL